MSASKVKFGEWIEGGFNLFKAHVGILVLAHLLVVLVTIFSLGLLGPVLMAGMLLLVARLIDKAQPAPKASDIFKGFDYLGQGLLLTLIYFGVGVVLALLSQIPCIGFVIYLAAVIALLPVIAFAPCALVFEKKNAADAIKSAIELAKPNYLLIALFVWVAQAIASLGTLLCGVGLLFTGPISVCIILIAYRDLVAQRSVNPPEAPSPQTV